MKIKSFLLQTVVIASIAFTFYGSKGLAAQAPAAQVRVASVPLEIAGENYVLIKARVNVFEPMTFILDSGAGSGLVLYHKAAETLKLRTAGKGKGGGAGATTYETALIKSASLSVGGVTMNNQTFVVYPPESPPPNMGQPVDGVIGYSLFSRY